MSSLSLVLLLMESSTADSITATPLPKTNRDGSEHSRGSLGRVEFRSKVCSSPFSHWQTEAKSLNPNWPGVWGKAEPQNPWAWFQTLQLKPMFEGKVIEGWAAA